MGMHDKIRMMRELRQWSQEEMAEKMNMSPSGYAKIERGETRLQYDKLVQIAQIFNITLSDLVDDNRGFVFLLNENGNNTSTNYYGNNDVLVIEIEKLKLQISHKDELLIQKEKELEMLRKMITLFEKKIV